MQLNDQKNSHDHNVFQVLLLFFTITRVIALVFSFGVISDIPTYYSYYKKVSFSLLPYINFGFEYQPLALIPVIFPGVLGGGDLATYLLIFMIFIAIFDLLNLYLSILICKEYKLDSSATNFMILLYSLFGLLMFRLLYQRLDVIVATFILLSVLMFIKRKNNYLYLGSYLGFFYKIIPAFNLPAAIFISEINKENFKEGVFIALKKAITFIFFLITAILILTIITNHSYLESFSYHTKRGIQIESIFGSIILFKHFITNTVAPIGYDYGSFNVSTNPSIEILSKYLGFVILFAFYIFLFIYAMKGKLKRSQFLEISLLIFLIFISFQRVLSPQFLIWVMPLLAIYFSINKSNFNFLLSCLIYLLTSVIFFPNYYSLVNQEPILINLLLLRNLLLIFLTYKIFSKLLIKLNNV